jgi:hypothetical protein
MFETYPKSSAHPSKSVGEARCPPGWAGNPGTVDYPAEPNTGTAYQGDRSKTKFLAGGSGSKNKSDYPGGKYETFGTEKLDKR